MRLVPMSDEPPRVFLSYGVHDAWDVAERLHRDLTARGYKICQDISAAKLPFGWTTKIERFSAKLACLSTRRGSNRVTT
jgi:hypothetical protein